MSDREQRHRESKERIRAASPPGAEVVQEEDSTDGVVVDQERSSPGHSGGHEQPLEDQHSPKPLGATGGEGGMSQRNPSDQTITDNTASIEVITPVQVVNDKAVSKLLLGSNCNHANRENCPISHCREWQQEMNEEGVMVFQPTMAPGVIVLHHPAF